MNLGMVAFCNSRAPSEWNTNMGYVYSCSSWSYTLVAIVIMIHPCHGVSFLAIGLFVQGYVSFLSDVKYLGVTIFFLEMEILFHAYVVLFFFWFKKNVTPTFVKPKSKWSISNFRGLHTQNLLDFNVCKTCFENDPCFILYQSIVI